MLQSKKQALVENSADCQLLYRWDFVKTVLIFLFHLIREHVLKKDLQVKYITTSDQLADVFTKSLFIARFQGLRAKIMVCVNPMVLTIEGMKEEDQNSI